jgi:hypothetical protein
MVTERSQIMTRAIAAGWVLATAMGGGLLADGAVAAESLPRGAGFALQDQPGEHLELLLDGKPVARYMVAFAADRLQDTYKPYLHMLDAEGQAPITKGPGGLYPHHRGIFIGWTRLTLGGKAYDLWGMGGGVQVHQAFRDQKAGPDQASFTSVVHWNAKGGEPLLEEERSFTFHRRPAPTLVLVDVVSKLKAVAGDTWLNGDPEHAGVHYRPANEVDKSKTKYLFPKEGDDPRKDKDLAWAAEAYVLGDKTYTVQQMNHPSNPQGTLWSAYRDYGRLGAFCTKELKNGDTLVLSYRFWVLAGDLPPRDELQTQWNGFAGIQP